ncbi:MAG: peroxidase family protein [Acidimicrobiales bacterium]
MRRRHPQNSARSGKGRVSRRGFLGGIGTAAVGAGAVAAGARSVLTDDLDLDLAQAQQSSGNFGRMFGDLPPFFNGQPAEAIEVAMRECGRPGGMLDANDDLSAGPVELILNPDLSVNNPDNPTHTAGTTFFGQFLDHDLTFDATSALGVVTRPERTPNARTPLLDLDSLYGRGPFGSPRLYEGDRTKLRIESGGLFEDVPREANGTAIIGDPRNDENMMISGLQSAFILFHNNIVDHLRETGTRDRLFETARRLVTWHYQWIVVHEFLPQMLGQEMVDTVFRPRGRRFYRPRSGPFMPIEFQTGTYRIGHTMVRPSYRANMAGNPDGTAFFGMIFDPAGEGQADPVDLRGGKRAPRRFIGWQTFFDFGDGELKTNKRMDINISTPLYQLPLGTIPSGDPPISLPERNMLRHITWSIPSGQAVAQRMGVPALGAADFPELDGMGLNLQNSTPMWHYVCKEAEVMEDGLHMGPVGGRIVGEVFAGVLQLDPNSYLHRSGWRPTLPDRAGNVTGNFTMVDLLTFAGVDPASRGQ